MLRTNLRNQVRQTPLPKWKPIIPLFEAVMNSIQSIRDPKRAPGPGSILIEIERENDLLNQADSPIDAFTITDNGIGLDDENFDSFNTAYSDLKESVGGKGLGRFTWLKAFERAEIETHFQPADEPRQLRKFIFHEGYDADDGLSVPDASGPVGMKIRLVGFKEPYRSQFPKTADRLAQRLVEHFLLIFLQPDCPRITIHDQGQVISANAVFENEFKTTAHVHEFSIKGVAFTLHGFRLTTPRLTHHKLTYAANQRGVVSDYLKDYIPNLSSRLPAGDGKTFVFLGIVQSPYLTQHVNPARTDFDIDSDDAEIEDSLFEKETIRRPEIRDAAIAFVRKDLEEIIGDINRDKETRIRAFVRSEAPQYKILMKYASEFIDSIGPSASKTEIEAALHRELFQRETRMKQESSRIIKEAAKLDDYEGYTKRLSSFMESYNELGAAALAQYVTHRKIILDFLAQAIESDPDTKRYPLEEVVHQLVFPMRATSDDIPYHEQNLWMIDERLTFHSFIASDKRLSAIPDQLQSDSRQRPDLMIFDEKIIFAEGAHPINSIITVEFKRPGRDDYTAGNNPVLQSFELIEKIRGGTFKIRGRPISVSNEKIPATAYCICDLTPTMRKALSNMDAFVSPDGQGYYGFHRTYGVFYEVIDYNKLLRDARQRNRIFFDKLNLADSAS